MSTIETRLAELVGPVLAELPVDDRPAVIALAERIAAGRYRGWAEQVPSSTAKQILVACSAREDEIAEKVEAMIPRAAEIQASALEAHADLPARYAALFEGCSLEEQFSMQARAERVGSATWRALARRGPAERERVFLECAALEEASAGALESLIADGLAV